MIGGRRDGYGTRVRHPMHTLESALCAPVSERVVCPCGCIFQAVSDSDECWTCGRSAAAIQAEQEAIVASIRGLPELDARA